MVNVYTKNGQFDISESLMEAIKANQPEILLETKKEILLEDDLTIKELEKQYIKSRLRKASSNVFSDSNIEKVARKDKDLASDIRKYRNKIKRTGSNLIDYDKLYDLYTSDSDDFKKIKSFLDEPYKKLSKEDKKEDLQQFINKVIPDMSKSFAHYFTGNPEAAKDFENDIRTKMAHMDFNGTVEDLYTFIHDMDKTIDDEEEELKQREKLEKGINDADDQILFQQLVKHGLKNLPKTLEVNGVTLTKDQMQERIDNNSDLSDAWDKYRKSTKNVNLAKQYNNDITNAENNLVNIESHVHPKTLKELLNSQRLINEINSIEQSARVLIKKAEVIIPRTLGLFASSSHNAGSDNSANDNMKGRVSQSLDNFRLPKAVNEDVNNEISTIANDNTNPNSKVINDNNPSKVNFMSGLKNLGRLATGGMVLEPLFNGNPSEKEYYGKALKAYKSYLMDKNNKSLVDNLIDEVIELHSNKNNYKEKIKQQGVKDDEINDLFTKLDNVSASFLGNVVFSLKVGNDKNFNDVVRAIRFSDLRELYHVSNEGTVQMLNAREQNIVFTQDNNVIVGIFIATPILQITRDILNKASGLMNSFRKAKA